MIHNNYFMLVPVYRLPEEKYYLELERDFARQLESTCNEDFCSKNRDLVEQWRRHHHESYGGSWEFNEIIGYIKLYFTGTQVRGEYWSTAPKRKVRTRKKQYEYKTHNLYVECEVWENTNEGILSAIEEYLAGCKKELKDRHIDLREFEALKNHIDWQSLIRTKNEFA